MGVRSLQGLRKRQNPMSGRIREAASRAFDAPVAEASSSSVPQAPVEAHLGPAVRPTASVHDRLVARRLLHAGQVTPQDRWAIAAYIRALQLSRNAPLSDATPADRAALERAP